MDLKNLKKRLIQIGQKVKLLFKSVKIKLHSLEKKRAIKISVGSFEIISDTKLNDDLHGGYPSWINGDSWNLELIKKYVKNCNKISSINRFKIKYI